MYLCIDLIAIIENWYLFTYLILLHFTVYTIFARVICALFSILAAEKSGWAKYADFFVEVLIWVLF